MTVALLNAGYEVVILDDFSRSKRSVVVRIAEICGREPTLCTGDISDLDFVLGVIGEHKVDSIIHFAGLKSVPESYDRPLDYYRTNVVGTIRLLEALVLTDVSNFVYSSTAAVYNRMEPCPIGEEALPEPTSPYGRTKWFTEMAMADFKTKYPEKNLIALRYFNPVGAHPSGLIGEDPLGEPGNLFPFIGRVISGEYPLLSIFGSDYDTPDGTCVRDFIHVMDLADGHLHALDFAVQNSPLGQFEVFNLGTGRGHSVLEVVRAFEEITKRTIPKRFVSKRSGDIACSFADVRKAEAVLGWSAQKGLFEMCRDALRWQAYCAEVNSGGGLA